MSAVNLSRPVRRRKPTLPPDYIRTLKDEEDDRREFAWKAERNNAARLEFLRNYPSARPPVLS